MKSAAIIPAAIVAAALVACTGLYLYFSPYHSCVRVLVAADYTQADAALACLHGLEPEDKGEAGARPFTRTRWSTATR